MKEKINMELLRQEIRGMSKYSIIYKVLKDELKKRGYWKNRPRGDALKGYKASLAKRHVMQR